MAQDWSLFDEFLWDCFCDGQCSRELRLSEEELAYLSQRYPLQASRPESAEEQGRCWYHITLQRGSFWDAQGA